ncbi:hypothetical protein GCM10009718_13330 [Isoptericola halotolerans]|uniref:Telomeric repeat-binding factor 2 n=1 Tax=Isoptericola halotolerans TaxID=300560 RepID=A0ABX2A1W7_9MICO|nr:hypothetical protein [Isoptericola halotolerans]NOV95747.1 hypothetical protein [Isoptericola halotolerans]
MRSARSTTTLALSCALVLGLAACGTGDEAETVDTSSAETAEDADAVADDVEEPTEDEAEEPEDAEEEPADDAAGGSGAEPEWANPLTTPGEEITSFTVGDVRVDVYQVGVTQAPKDGLFVDPEKNEPIIAEGDDIVFVNYVITNEGDTVDLGSSLVNISARYEDWPYMQGMDTITGAELYEEQEVNDSGTHQTAYRDPAVYPFESGQSYSTGMNFHYQPGTDVIFDATIVPVDENGDLLHDDKVEGEGTGTIS